MTTFGKIIDVSQYNGAVDYPRLAKSGIVGGYIRALVGLGTRDEKLAEHVAGFKSVGLPFGVYGDDFARHAPRAQDAYAQAEQLADIHIEVGATWRPMVDVEPEGVPGVTGAEWASSVVAYVDGLERAAALPLLYTGSFFWSSFPELRECVDAGRCMLWLAAYMDAMPAAPSPWSRVAVWQRQGGGGETLPTRFRGRVDGVAGDVDVSDLLVDPSELEA